jgi:hypothetical protein
MFASPTFFLEPRRGEEEGNLLLLAEEKYRVSSSELRQCAKNHVYEVGYELSVILYLYEIGLQTLVKTA